MRAERRGRVEKKPIAAGSKSEHVGVVLVSEEGEYELRRVGGNAFQDPELEKLVGKDLRVAGEERGSTLIVSEWSEL